MFRRIRHLAASALAEKRREPARQRIRRRARIPLRPHGTESSEKAAEAAGSTSEATPPAAGTDAHIPAESESGNGTPADKERDICRKGLK